MMWAGWPDHPGYLFRVTEYAACLEETVPPVP